MVNVKLKYLVVTVLCTSLSLSHQELLKYTSESHPDRPAVEAAVEAMRQVATHINEGKRRLENIGRIGKWQESIDGWKVGEREGGEDMADINPLPPSTGS